MPRKPASLVDGGITKGEIQHLTRDLAPLGQSELRTLKQDMFTAGHQYLFLAALQQLQKAARRNTLNGIETLRLAQAMGIATDKSLLLAGRPTSLVMGMHQVRHELPDILAKMIRVGGMARTVPTSLPMGQSNSPLDGIVVDAGT